MAKANYKQIEQYLPDGKPFEGNSMRAEVVNGLYKVYSYKTLIAYANANDVWVTDKGYSSTTEKHKKMCTQFLRRGEF